MNKKILNKILFIEDDPNDIELSLAFFKKYNIVENIDILRDGEEALDYFNNAPKDFKPPQVILVDVKLPKIDGLQVLHFIKSSQYRYIPTVCLISSREEEDNLKKFNLGANSFMVKPFNYQDFSIILKNLELS